MTIVDEAKIDCHKHIFDTPRFPCRANTAYRPSGQETGAAEQFKRVMSRQTPLRLFGSGHGSGR